MKKVKFYYSEATHLAYIPVLTDGKGEAMFILGKKMAKIKKIPRVTVASVYDPKTNTMTFGTAICSTKDLFKKSIGREIAEKRARQFPEITIVGIDPRKLGKVSKRHANDLIEKHLSKWYVPTEAERLF